MSSHRQVHPLDPQEVLAEQEERHPERMCEHRLDHVGRGRAAPSGLQTRVAGP